MMTNRVLVLDTSVLCCLLQVPGKDTAGSISDRWDYERVSELLESELEVGSLLVLPLASIIETGNHVSQASKNRSAVATEFAKIISLAANASSPWAAFTDQADLWGKEQLETLAMTWPHLANGGLSIGDATIKDVAEYYAKAGFHVEIVTGDAGLKAHQPSTPILVPRRRKK